MKLLALGLCAFVLTVAVVRSDWKGIMDNALRRDETA